jgi:SOS response regulatory protein OraA/RecX
MSDIRESVDKLYSKILDFVSYTFRTEKEVRNRASFYLRKISFPPDINPAEVVEEIINKLKLSRDIDDDDYTRRYIEGLLLSSKSKSPREASMFLYRKGIPEAIYSKYLDRLGGELEEKSLTTLVEKKARSIKSLKDPVARNKLIRYLISKGFDPGRARAEVDKIASLK